MVVTLIKPPEKYAPKDLEKQVKTQIEVPKTKVRNLTENCCNPYIKMVRLKPSQSVTQQRLRRAQDIYSMAR